MELGLDKLNKEQKEAVTFGNGPFLIIAGAGTGKTTVITKRIAYLIQRKKAKPEEILALTFTEKAAEEMEQRVDRFLPYGYVDLWIMTFHSFCKRVLEEYGLDIGLPSDFALLDQTAAWLLIRKNLSKFKLDYYKPLGNPTKFIHALIKHFARCKDQMIYPENYLKYAQKLKSDDATRVKEVAEAYCAYQQLLLDNDSLDFGDLINYCLKLFQKRPKILKSYRERFKYVLIDEFQDTNWAQYQLTRLLASPKNNLTVCADDDQAIYRFRGASFGNIVQFRKDYPKAKRVVLIKNYRSCQDILDLAYQLIKQNNPNRLEYLEKINKNLIAVRKERAVIEHLHFKTVEQEVTGVVDRIVEILEKDRNANLSDFAVLVRANKTANAFCRALERAGLAYQFLSLRGLYSKPIILDIISYFKLLDDYHESPAVYRILSMPFLGIPTDDIAKLTRFSRKKAQSLYETLRKPSLISGLSKKTANKINFILSLVEKHSELVRRKNVSEVFIAFLEESGYLEYLVQKNKKEDIDYINQFYGRIKAFEETDLDARLAKFIEELDMEKESGEQGKLKFDLEQGPNMIKIMTVHSAKGLEFKYVFMVGLVDRRFPAVNRANPIEIPQSLIKDILPQGDVYLEEERRLFYVGMTRAKKGLFFTSAQDYGGERKKKLSRFLKELNFDKPKLQRREIAISKPSRRKIKSKEQEEAISPEYFSFTQFRAFENCPLQYKFAHILKIPIRGKAVFSYGKSLHNTLFEFVKKAMERKRTLSDLFKVYKEEWIDEWFDSQEEKEKYYKQGKESLKRFYKEFYKAKPEILLINKQLALEQGFRLKINSSTVIGKIDRIDKTGDKVEIIDYKTGKTKGKLKEQEKQQLLIYQIAAEETLGLMPEKLTYYYIDSGERISFIGTEEDKEKQKQEMLAIIDKIKKSELEPTPGWQCRYCDFKDICGYARFNS